MLVESQDGEALLTQEVSQKYVWDVIFMLYQEDSAIKAIIKHKD